MLTPARNILRSNLARLVIVNLFSLTALVITFIVVLKTFANLRQLIQVEVSQKATMAAKSFAIGKAFVILESEIHSLHNTYLHDPEGIIVNRKDILARFDAIIMEAKTSENFLRLNQGVDALQNYRQSLTQLLDDEVLVSKNALALELKNRHFLQSFDKIEEDIGQLIMDETLLGTQATGILQINALIPFCREQILNARFLIDQAAYTHTPGLLIDPTPTPGNATLASVISTLRQTLSTMTSATPAIAQQTNGILNEIPDYWRMVENFDSALRSTILQHKISTTNRDRIVGKLSDADQQTVTSLQKIGGISAGMLARMTTTIYTVTSLIILVSVIGGVLIHFIGRQLAFSAKAAEEARAGLHEQLIRLNEAMTSRLKAESEVRKLNENLEEIIGLRTRELATANDELEAFVTAMSHDLRTPLRGIAGFSHALQEEYGNRLDAQAHAYLDRIQEACLRVGVTIDSILVISRFSRCAMTIAEVDLSSMAESIIAELKRNEPERQLQITISPTPKVEADPSMMRALLDPLLANAWKFTSRTAMATIEFGSYDKNGRPIFFIKDNGAGFNTAYGAKLFQPFQRLHSPDQFPGIGIGLALAKRIIKRYHGEIWAEGREERGATISFSLAATKASA